MVQLLRLADVVALAAVQHLGAHASEERVRFGGILEVAFPPALGETQQLHHDERFADIGLAEALQICAAGVDGHADILQRSSCGTSGSATFVETELPVAADRSQAYEGSRRACTIGHGGTA